ncbi:hypothetical protein C8A03DRAFT_36627 [Achaetomium macrosporum]|uniref:RING-type domain-containing protein n=1 Tax=Achaetomium macrosporum TaxID=79813 RepID=A0AAN7H570_9PEZI|nr:hypothetical protein C8A03DRAFT_36627 [Achaetomium macrosporum]
MEPGYSRGRCSGSGGATSIFGWTAGAPGGARCHSRRNHGNCSPGRGIASEPRQTARGTVVPLLGRQDGKYSEVRIRLRPLDSRSKEFASPVLIIDVPKGLSISVIKRLITDSSEDRNGSLQVFDEEGKELAPNVKVTAETAEFWYRVSGHLSGWRFTHWQDETDGPLEDKLAAVMHGAISRLATVGQLKEAVARHIGIEDTNRVIIIARDGMRRGALDGNHWEVIQVKQWLCRWLSIDIAAPNGYVVFRTLGRECVYCPFPQDAGKSMPLEFGTRYFADRVLRGVHQRNKSELSDGTELSVRLNGVQLNLRFARLKWRATYDVDLPGDVAEAFSLEESWLLQETEACIVCAEAKKLSDMPIKITPHCKHRPKTCKECLKHWIDTRLGDGMSDKVTCPECSLPLGWHDVKRAAFKATLARYDRQLLHKALRRLEDFHYCLSPRCQSGQIHDAKCPEFRCGACAARQCVRHNLPWHEGETCEQYNKRNPKRAQAEKASKAEIQTSTRTCPECGRVVYKSSGCNHITCVCGHEWCYLCLATYAEDPVDHMPLDFHTPDCPDAAGMQGLFGHNTPYVNQRLRQNPDIRARLDRMARQVGPPPPPPPVAPLPAGRPGYRHHSPPPPSSASSRDGVDSIGGRIWAGHPGLAELQSRGWE